ncbi:MAG: class I SAM-dependent rRNA methyltransferase [Bacteriovorax sp.]|jgi:23S rRNA (cytosine1962-C5)-methyltransferase
MNESLSLINFQLVDGKLPEINLIRDVSKHIKRGHRWIFADCFDQKARQPQGLAILKSRNEVLGFGLIQSDTQLRFRVLCLADEPFVRNNNIIHTMNAWSEFQWKKAVAIRKNFSSDVTNSFRLINGEGDGMPGLIIDIYDDTAVIKHDHEVVEKFWNHQGLALKLTQDFPQIKTVYHKRRNDDDVKGIEILGKLKEEVVFKENGSLFATNIRDAAKTGFFLDQRDNRKLIGQFSEEKRVLNLFSYTAGFSVFAARGGAREVTSVDIAKAATLAAGRNFEVNGLKTKHEAIAQDAFLFIDERIKDKSKWDMVITDPPSFAPNQKAVDTAVEAYIKIFSQSLKLVSPNGLFAASSCSSHISTDKFLEICREAFSKNRKRGTVVYLGGQPFDHPYPIAMEELRYLKFALFRVD